MKTSSKQNEIDTTSNRLADVKSACIGVCRKMIARLQRAKDEVLNEYREMVAGREHLLQLAVNEAEALAWETEVPQLVFPLLATEKAAEVAAWQRRQQAIQQTGLSLALAA